jgi:hypothetical protein
MLYETEQLKPQEVTEDCTHEPNKLGSKTTETSRVIGLKKHVSGEGKSLPTGTLDFKMMQETLEMSVYPMTHE